MGRTAGGDRGCRRDGRRRGLGHRRAAARHGGAGRLGRRRPRRPAVERHQVSGRCRRPGRRVRGIRSGRAHRTGAGGILHDHQAALAARCRTGQRRTGRCGRAAARLAHLAAAWVRPGRRRRRSPSRRAGDRPIGCERNRLLEPGDRRLRPGAAGRGARPRRGAAARARTVGVGHGCRGPARRPRRGRQRRGGARRRCPPRGCRGVGRHERHRLRGERERSARRDRHGRGLRRCRWALPAPGRDAERGPGARRRRPGAGSGPRRAVPAGAAGFRRRGRSRPAALLRGRAHPQPAGCHRHALGHDPGLDHSREPRTCGRRGHAVRARRRPDRPARPGGPCRARPADRGRRAVRGRTADRASCWASRSRCRRPRSTWRSAPPGRPRACWTPESRRARAAGQNPCASR